jgi:hypothetical protein
VRNPIFTKAEQAAAALRASGHLVDVSLHPTSWGNSAYVTTQKSVNGWFIRSGFRLSDHEVGDRRKEMDEVRTIINGGDISVEYLVKVASISDASLSRLAEKAEESRAADQIEAEKQQAEALQKAEADAARAAYEARMVAARESYIAAHHPEFDSLTKTKQRPIIKAFNKSYREDNPE